MSDRKILLQRLDSLFLFLEGLGGMWTLQHFDAVAQSQTVQTSVLSPRNDMGCQLRKIVNVLFKLFFLKCL